MNAIDYANLLIKALRSVPVSILRYTEENGLPKESHFVIEFASNHPEVRMPEWLVEKYPETMTVVLQNWFQDLKVGADSFSVTLNFNDHPENILVPFEAMQSFTDPSVGFRLEFPNPKQVVEDNEGPADRTLPEIKDEERQPNDAETGKVVSLDRFRKK